MGKKYDGSLVFDTHIDTKEFENDTKKLKSETEKTGKQIVRISGEKAAKIIAESQKIVEARKKAAAKAAEDAKKASKEAVEAARDAADQAANDIESKGREVLGKIGGMAKAGIAAIGAAITAAVKVGSDFEGQMSKVGAISLASSDDMDILTAKAKEMGETTVFSATQAGEAFEYMAMAGWKTDEMTAGITGIMNLAAASGENLASVSDIVTDALTAFGLKASDSTHFADVLATAASSANTNVGMMGETFKYVAPVAGALGYSVEDVSVAIGLMANSGIKASQAGTALRAILARLTNPSKETATAMEQLGISLTDTNGKMKPLKQLIQEMRSRFKGMAKDQQASTAAMLGGQEAMSALLAIVNASENDFNNLSKAIGNADGTASEMADRNLDNLKGKLTLAGSAAEALGISIYEGIEEPLKDVVENGTEYLQSLAEKFSDPVFMNNTMVLFKCIGIVSSAVLGYKAATSAAAAAQALLNTTMSLSPAGLVIGGIVGLTAAVFGVVSAVKEADSEYYKIGERLTDVSDRFDAAKEKAQLTDEYIAKWQELKQKIDDNALSAEDLESAQKEVKSCEEWFIENYGDYVSAEEKKNGVRAETIDRLKEQSRLMSKVALAELESETIDAMGKMDDYQKTVDVLTEANKKLDDRRIKLYETKSGVQELVNEWEKFNEAQEDFGSAGTEEKLREIIEKINELTGYNFNGSGMAGVAVYLQDIEKQTDSLKKSVETNEAKINDAKDGIKAYLSNVQKLIDCDVEAPLKAKEETAKKFGVNFADGVVAGLVEQSPEVKKKVEQLTEDAVKAAKKKAGIKSPSRVMRDEVGKMLVAGVGVGITENEKLAITAMENACVKLEKVSEDAAKNAEELEKKRRERELKNLKNSLDLGLITEQEYYEKLKDYRDKYFEQGTDSWYSYTEEIAKYNKKMSDNAVEEQKKMVEKIIELRDELADKLRTDNDSLLESTQTTIHGSIFGEDGSGSYTSYSLADLEKENSRLERYRDVILKLKDLGNVPAGIFTKLRDMSVEDGTRLAETILNADEKARSKFLNDYRSRDDLSEDIATQLSPILNAEKFEEEGIVAAQSFTDGYSKKLEEDKAAFIKILENRFGALPDFYYNLGTDSADEFGKGFFEKAPEIVERFKQMFISEINSIAATISSGTAGKIRVSAAGGGNTYHTNTFTFNAAKQTVTEQLNEAKRAATLAKIRGN